MRLSVLFSIIAALSIFVVFSSQSASAATFTLSDQASCQAAPFSGTWDASISSCTVSGFGINGGDSVVINSGITLTNDGSIVNSDFGTGMTGTIVNNGIINNNSGGHISNFIDINNNIGGTINNSGNISNDKTNTNNGDFTNTGTIFFAGRSITNTGTFTNAGTITVDGNITNNGAIINDGTINEDDAIITNNGTITNNSGASFKFCCTNYNSGTITNSGAIDNTGTINNNCGGTFTDLGIFTGNPIVYTCISPTTTVPSFTGNGPVTFSTSAGQFSSATAIPESKLSSPPPTGVYPFGFFSWIIRGISLGGSATVTITYPSDPGTVYEKLINGAWVTIPATVTANPDGTFTVTLSLTDGGTGDADQTVNGKISDPGGMGTLESPAIPEFPFSFSLVIMFVAVTAVYLGIRQKIIPNFKR